MSEILPNPNPEPSLYGEESKPAVPQAQPQSVWDQWVGVFTEPSAVFKRLRLAPSWVGAFILTLAVGLFATLTWAAKVDMEAAAKRKFEVMEQAFNMNIPSEVMDKALEKASTQSQPYISSSLGVLIAIPLIFLILAGILFAFSKFGGEDENTTFTHAWSATIVHGLSMLPITLLGGLMCILRNVGGAASYASLAPTHLGFWIQPDNPWLRGLLALVDPFYLFSFVVLYFAVRHTLRLKPWATGVVLGITGFFGLLFHFIGGIF